MASPHSRALRATAGAAAWLAFAGVDYNALHRRKMGGAGSRAVDCASAPACAVGEPQEACDYYSGRCDWDVVSACRSELVGCTCPAPTFGVASSALPPHIGDPVSAATIALGPVMLWSLTFLIPCYRYLYRPPSERFENGGKLLPRPRAGSWRTSAFPAALRPLLPRLARLCIPLTAAIVLAVHLTPATAWGECATAGTCVYHAMFCEATRHGVQHRDAPAGGARSLALPCPGLRAHARSRASLREALPSLNLAFTKG